MNLNKKEFKYKILKDGFASHNFDDIWIMVYSTAISLVVNLIPSFLLTFEEESHLYPTRKI